MLNILKKKKSKKKKIRRSLSFHRRTPKEMVICCLVLAHKRYIAYLEGIIRCFRTAKRKRERETRKDCEDCCGTSWVTLVSSEGLTLR